jgi:hypothetical protein
MLNFIVSGRWVAENEGPEVQSWGGEDLFHCGGSTQAHGQEDD